MEWDHPNPKSQLEPYIAHGLEGKNGLRKSELFQRWFPDLNSYDKALLAQKRPLEYPINIGHQPAAGDESYKDPEKFIEVNGCNISADGVMKIMYDVEKLHIFNCTIDLSEEEEVLFSWSIPVPDNICSSLSRIEIANCKNIKKLFSSNYVLHSLQNLDILCVKGCQEIEALIASESAWRTKKEWVPIPSHLLFPS